jgi:hypothetical protein
MDFSKLNEETSDIYRETLEKQNIYIDARIKSIKIRYFKTNLVLSPKDNSKEDIANFLNLGIAANLIQNFFKFEESSCVVCKKTKEEVRQFERAHCNKFSRYDLLMMAINKLYSDTSSDSDDTILNINTSDILKEFILLHKLCPIYYLCNKCHKAYDKIKICFAYSFFYFTK